MSRGGPGSKGGRETLKRYGVGHFRELGKRGFQAFTDRYFAGDRQQATDWLQTRAHERQIEKFADRELQRRIDDGADIVSMELPILSDPDEDGIPF